MAYSLGIDFGTQSGRVILLDLDSGHELAAVSVPYEHGVIDKVLPLSQKKLPPDWALQDPLDYIEVVHTGIRDVVQNSGVDSNAIIGIGVDFTSCTVLPVDMRGDPLCVSEKWEKHPHAWPKLWKHHAAQPIADRINQIAERRGEEFLTRYGGRISSEWYFPKLIEVFEEDRAVYSAMHAFIEATDWIVWYLTGSPRRNSCTAGYKSMWSEETGIPDEDFFMEVNPDFINPSEKLGNEFYPLGTRAGVVRPELAQTLGLGSEVFVAVGNVDAMVSAPSVGMDGPGNLTMVMGTSICHLLVTDHEVRLPGITGVVKDGVLPGYYGYEAGQAAVGDMFEWFVTKAVPNEYHQAAESMNLSIYEYLEQKASELKPGENGLIALDWWNGSRSILGDADLTGTMVGLTLATSPEDIYRALLEASAYGTRRIIENFHQHGVELDKLTACGGLPQKSPLLMQIYADVCKLPVTVPNSAEIPARGSALFGAVAAGEQYGGFDSITHAANQLAAPILKTYRPIQENVEKYQGLYSIYREIHDFFGEDSVRLMHKLKDIRLQTFH